MKTCGECLWWKRNEDESQWPENMKGVCTFSVVLPIWAYAPSGNSFSSPSDTQAERCSYFTRRIEGQ